MKKFVIAMLFAAVSAQTGYACTDPDSSWSTTDMSAQDAATDADSCKANCEATIAAGDTDGHDWCCSSEIVAEPAAV